MVINHELTISVVFFFTLSDRVVKFWHGSDRFIRVIYTVKRLL